MFEYIKLKNFKSFGNIEFNLSDRKGIPKNLIHVYGENGIGKSNLASAFILFFFFFFFFHVIRNTKNYERSRYYANDSFRRPRKFSR